MKSEPALEKLLTRLSQIEPNTKFTAQELIGLLTKLGLGDTNEVYEEKYTHHQYPPCKFCGSSDLIRKGARNRKDGTISRTYKCKKCKSHQTTHEKVVERRPTIKE